MEHQLKEQDFLPYEYTPTNEPEELKTQIDQAIETYTRHMLSESKPYSEMTNKELRALAVDEITEVFFPVVNQKEDQNERETVEEQE